MNEDPGKERFDSTILKHKDAQNLDEFEWPSAPESLEWVLQAPHPQIVSKTAGNSIIWQTGTWSWLGFLSLGSLPYFLVAFLFEILSFP
jgi:hypothetical protein